MDLNALGDILRLKNQNPMLSYVICPANTLKDMVKAYCFNESQKNVNIANNAASAKSPSSQQIFSKYA